MADITSLSDTDLQSLYQRGAPPPLADLGAMSDDDLHKLYAQSAPQMAGTAREIALPASGVAKGLVSVAGLPGDIVRGIGYVGGNQAASEMAGNPFPPGVAGTPSSGWPTSAADALPQGAQVTEGRAPIAAPSFHNPLDSESLLGLTQKLGITDRSDLFPQNARERYEGAAAQGVGAALPAVLTGGLSASRSIPDLARALIQGGAGGAGAQAGGELGGAVGGPTGSLIGTGLGAVLAGKFAPGGGGVGSMIPSGMDAETRALAQVAQSHGIDVSLGQATDSPFIKYADSAVRRLPFSGYGSFDKANQEKFNAALAGTFGEDASKITPDVLDRAQQRIGGVMNDVANRTSLPMDAKLQGDLANTVRLAQTAGLQPGQADAIQRQIQNIGDIAAQNGGTIPGQVYQNLTKRGEALDLLQGNRSTTSGQLGGQIRDALDEAMTRGASPADVAALQQARTQYKALKTVGPLTMRADATGGATPSTGDISPAALLSRVRQQYPTAARQGVGEIPLKDLAQVGQRFLKEPPSSGTSERLTVQGIMHGLGGAIAPMLGAEAAHVGMPLHAVVPAVIAGVAGPVTAGRILRSPALPQASSPLAAALMGAEPQMQNLIGTPGTQPPLLLGPRAGVSAMPASSMPR